MARKRKTSGKSKVGFFGTLRTVQLLLIFGITALIVLCAYKVSDSFNGLMDFVKDPLGHWVPSSLNAVDDITKWAGGDRNRAPYEDPFVVNTSVDKQLYFFTLKTRDQKEAGTDGNISIRLEGSKGATNMISLDEHLKKTGNNLWQKGGNEQISIITNDVGYIQRLTVDQKGGAFGVFGNDDAWAPEQITIDVNPMEIGDYQFRFDIPNGTKIDGDSMVFTPTAAPPIEEQSLNYYWLSAGALSLVALIVVVIKLRKKGLPKKRRK